MSSRLLNRKGSRSASMYQGRRESLCPDQEIWSTFKVRNSNTFYSSPPNNMLANNLITLLPLRYRSKYCNSMIWCKRCFTPFRKTENFAKHKVNCQQQKYQIPKFPLKGEKLRFVHTQYGFWWPIVLFCDFECLLILLDDVRSSSTKAYQNHEPCSFSITIASIWPEFETPTFVFSHSDPETVKKTFISKLKQIRRKALKIMDGKKFPIDMSPQDEQAFQNATECFMCGKSNFSLTDKKWMKARDHDHYVSTSNYRGKIKAMSIMHLSSPNTPPPALPQFTHSPLQVAHTCFVIAGSGYVQRSCRLCFTIVKGAFICHI